MRIARHGGLGDKQGRSILRIRWGSRRSPSVQLRVDSSVADIVRRLPESHRRSYVSRCISEESLLKYVCENNLIIEKGRVSSGHDAAYSR